MIDPRTALERRGDGANAFLTSTASDQRLVTSTDQRARFAAERAVDQVLADSFPASDPPSWTLGAARADPFDYTGSAESTDERVLENGDRQRVTRDVIDVSPQGTKRTFLQGLVSLG